MKENSEKEPQAKAKLTFKEKLKDKKERAKIELIGYGLFFVIAIIFARALGGISANIETPKDRPSFLTTLKDNYEYEITTDYEEATYNYHGKRLGNNGTLKVQDKEYYLMNNNYYLIDNGNYLLVTKEEINTIIDYNYLDLARIKKYISIGIKQDNTYKIKVSDLLLNSSSTKSITITINEDNTSLTIDYTPLFEELTSTSNQVAVTIHYYNINKLTSLAE